MLARMDFPAIAGKANLLRGRVAKFKTEAYTELGDEEKDDPDLARSHVLTFRTPRGKFRRAASGRPFAPKGT